MKTVVIKGKHNEDKINNIDNPIRNEAAKYKFDIDNYDHKKQIDVLNNLYLGNKIDYEKDMLSILSRKLSSYKAQDKQKNIWDQSFFITKEEALESLVASKLQCHYCKCNLLFLYNTVGEKKQWTLDRINNELGHFRSNVVIACLDCNLQRKDMNKDKFKFTKNLKIVRSE